MRSNIKTKLINLPIIILVVIIGFCLLRFPAVVSSGITSGLHLCAGVVIPALFPFMVFSSFLVKSGLCTKFGHIFEPFTRLLFKLPGCAAGAIFMSLIGGFPVGAKMTYELFKNHQITMSQAKRMMLFCVNPGPAFVINAVGFAMLGSSKIGVILYASLCITSILIGIVTSSMDTYEDLSPMFKTQKEVKKNNFAYAFTNSASDGAQSIFSVCVWVILFSCLGSLFSLIPMNENTSVAFKCLLEVTSGCNAASGIFDIPIIALVLGWSGVCVHCQVLKYLQGVGGNTFHFLIGRLANGTIASFVCSQLLTMFPCEVKTFSSNSLAFDIAFSISAPAAAALLFMSAMLILDLDTKQEIC